MREVFRDPTQMLYEGKVSVETDGFGTVALTPKFIVRRIHGDLKDLTHQVATDLLEGVETSRTVVLTMLDVNLFGPSNCTDYLRSGLPSLSRWVIGYGQLWAGSQRQSAIIPTFSGRAP